MRLTEQDERNETLNQTKITRRYFYSVSVGGAGGYLNVPEAEHVGGNATPTASSARKLSVISV